jgi:2-polyprenyl-3-methyl-5-hydroxy-6-metoxy-1,4-benzoquinol methylase
MLTAMAQANNTYVFDNAWQTAPRRLALLEAAFDSGTLRLLEALGVDGGWRCLEVGAGGGSVARWLGGRVGLSGGVLATDIDVRFLEVLDVPPVEMRRHDLAREEVPTSGGGYDLVHARALLEHVPEREQALERLVAVLRPGGWLLVEDFDFASFVPGAGMVAAEAALFGKVWEVSRAAGEARGSAADYGRRLYDVVRGQGLVDLGAEGRVAVAQGGSGLAQFWRLTIEQMRGLIVGPAALSEPELERYYALLDNPEVSWLMPTLVAVWGRKPMPEWAGMM